jgi:hypothetical protein
LAVSVASLVSEIKGQQQQLDDIKNKINFTPTAGDGLLHDATLFVPLELYKEGIFAKYPGSSIVPIDWQNKSAAGLFLRTLGDSSFNFDKVIWTTRDGSAANYLIQALDKAGLAAPLK